jgi:HD-GYP domain-containing protein (c-di-GMP phosphodiesterase class II)
MLYNNGIMEYNEYSEKKFSIVQEISSAILSIDNIHALANLILDFAISYTNAQKGSVMLMNDQDQLYILASKGMDMELADSCRVQKGEGIAGIVAESRSPLLVNDIEKDKRFNKKIRDRYDTKSFISCPMISKNKLLGVININDKKDQVPFTEDDFSLLNVIANQAAIALENALLLTELRMKAAELEGMNRRLIESDALKTEFYARVSHELRTPLNSIKGAIFYLGRSEKTTKVQQREFLNIISAESEKLNTLVTNLLDFIRLEDETYLIKKSVINLADALEEVFDSRSVKSILGGKQIKLKLGSIHDTSTILADRIRTVQLFINLVDGLSHYAQRGDTITVTAHENDFVEVCLTLPGRLPEMLLPDLFQARNIFQKEQPEEKMKLYLAWKIAEVHKWALTARNTEEAVEVILTIPKSLKRERETITVTVADMFMELISQLLDLNICSVMLADEVTDELMIKGARGLDNDLIKKTRLRFGDRIAGWVALEGKPLLIENIETDPRFGRKNIPQYNTKSLLCLPLKMHGKVRGVLNLNNKSSSEIFTHRDLIIASALSERISSFFEKLQLDEYREEDIRRYLLSFESLIKAVKKYRKKRSEFLDLVMRILDELAASEEDKKIATYISLIYDLGLTVIDESVLSKEKLSRSDIRILKAHPLNTIELLSSFEISPVVRTVILHHHERYDGSGYPDRLKDEDIPFLSRVLSIADAFYAMISDRPYRPAVSREAALQEIKKGAGTLYDPRVVEALNRALKLQ